MDEDEGRIPDLMRCAGAAGAVCWNWISCWDVYVTRSALQLDEAGQQAFEALLDMPDNPLWDMIAGRQEATHIEQQALLEKIRAV